MVNNAKMSAASDPDFSKINSTSWPAACPSKYEQHLISVTCGNTHYHWAVHKDISGGFMPSLFWRTPVLRSDEVDKNDSCEELARFLPKGCQKIVFGAEDGLVSKSQASKAASEKRIPALSIYIVSSNENHEAGLEYLFRDVPCRMYKFSAEDFFTKEQGGNGGIGVDRLAALRAAVAFHQNPCMVIDGGTALTYTGTDLDGNVIGGGIVPGLAMKFRSLVDYTGSLPCIEHEDLNRYIQKRESLAVSASGTVIATAAVAATGGSAFAAAVTAATGATSATAIATPAPSKKDENDFKTIFSTDTKDSIMKSTLSEFAYLCRAAVKGYLHILETSDSKGEGIHKPINVVKEVVTAINVDTDNTTVATTPTGATPMDIEKKLDPPAENNTKINNDTKKSEKDKVVRKKPNSHVLVTGGDGEIIHKLLQEDHSNIVPQEPDCDFPKEGDETYILKKVKHLIHYGISNILSEKTAFYENRSSNEEENKLRAEIIGQRIAKEFDILGNTDINERIFRGTIIAIAPGMIVPSNDADDKKEKSVTEALDNDWFYVRYDDGDAEHFGISELYDGLVLFHQHGESAIVATDGNKKKSDEAKETADMILQDSAKVQNHVKQKEDKKSITGPGSTNVAQGGKRATTPTGGKAAKSNKRQRKDGVAAAGPSTSSPAKQKQKTSKSPTTTATGQKLAAKESTKKAPAPAPFDPLSYEGQRVSKYFDVELYFGTVTRYIKPSIPGDVDLWHVLYDDDDQEDYDGTEMKLALALYKKMANSDPKKPVVKPTQQKNETVQAVLKVAQPKPIAPPIPKPVTAAPAVVATVTNTNSTIGTPKPMSGDGSGAKPMEIDLDEVTDTSPSAAIALLATAPTPITVQPTNVAPTTATTTTYPIASLVGAAPLVTTTVPLTVAPAPSAPNVTPAIAAPVVVATPIVPTPAPVGAAALLATPAPAVNPTTVPNQPAGPTN